MRISKSKFEFIAIIFVSLIFVFSFMDTINVLNGKHFIDIFFDKRSRGYDPIMFQLSMIFFIGYFLILIYIVFSDRFYRVGSNLYIKDLVDKKIDPLFSRKYISMAFRGTFQDDTNLEIKWWHTVIEKMTVLIYLMLWPLAKTPVISGIWETFIRSYYQGIGGFMLRACYYRSKLGYMGTDVFINVGVLIWKPKNVKIGTNTHINAYCQLIGHDDALIDIGENVHISHGTIINGRGGVKIGSWSSVGANCAIYSATHYHKFPDGRRASSSNMWPLEDQYMIVSPVIINEKTTVRWGCIILPGVEIGEWSIVGANSMVKTSVPPETIVAGNPAKKIGENN